MAKLEKDGHRLITRRTGDGVRLQARSGRDVTAAWGDLALAGHHLPAGTVLDGEAVIITQDERISFEAAQARTASSRARRLAAQRPAYYIAFDALQLPSGDARPRPYSERRAALLSLLAPAREHADPGRLCRHRPRHHTHLVHHPPQPGRRRHHRQTHHIPLPGRPHRRVAEDPPRGHDRRDRGRVHRHRAPAAGSRRTASRRTRSAVPAPDHGPGHPDRPASGPSLLARVRAGRRRLHTRERSGRCVGRGRHHPACGGHRGPPALTRPQASARLHLLPCCRVEKTPHGRHWAPGRLRAAVPAVYVIVSSPSLLRAERWPSPRAVRGW
ncbi:MULTISPECIES: hypothetical protein [Streptomyces]|uniref:ATP-dependent DNA ligase family profile domain-containing protein n=1 Tax=Streptomyces mirabilis TaxID=68239 RepID=A0ABU3UCA2_9ACTN|nr:MULTISPECIES: hypothetical protein [Streptomyces]MCX4616645.1 hypothetical protein [Streptomyces mirabilis]MCX5354871.1 hypothetical protein [Streptomyces mirabilis]MDU8991558.1 hypothetical protein [Streptomyces mirabilis]